MERWSKTLNTRLARGSAMAWYSVDERLLTIRLTPKIAQPVTRQPSPRRAACTTITTRAATDSAEAMPEVMLLAISSPSVYRLPTTGRAWDAVIGAIMPDASRAVVRGAVAGDRAAGCASSWPSHRAAPSRLTRLGRARQGSTNTLGHPLAPAPSPRSRLTNALPPGRVIGDYQREVPEGKPGGLPPDQPPSPRGCCAFLERQPRAFSSECVVSAQANASRAGFTKIPSARSGRSIRNFAGRRGG